jgi:hypothetical protein
MTVGKIWQTDVCYMPRSRAEFKYLLVFTERVTSYICGLALKNITAFTVSNALRIFLGIIPPFEMLGSDFGPEYSKIFTTECVRHGIQHINSIPKRSQVQGSSEIAIKILKQQLARLCASSDASRLEWEKQIPRTISTLNSFFPYRCSLSRSQLLFSPYINSSTRLTIKNPVRLQREQFQALNSKRILNLAKKENAHAVKDYKVGQFVTLNDPNLVTVAGSRQLLTPSSRDIYKILDVMKGGFSLRLMNLRTQGEITVVHSRVSYLNLEDINAFELGSDDLWETLTRLNIKNRNTFLPGQAKRKFQLIHPVSRWWMWLPFPCQSCATTSW